MAIADQLLELSVIKSAIKESLSLTVGDPGDYMRGYAAKIWDASGGAKRVIDKYPTAPAVWYDPSDLVWNWRRNLLTYTEQFDNAAWTKSNATVTADATTAPDGTLTADALIENTATSVDHFFTQTVVKAASAATTYTVTIFAKSFGRDLFLLADGGAFANRARVVFDLSAGTISSAASTAGTFSLASATITADQEGYYRCSLTFTTGTEPSVRVQAYLADGTATTYTGDGTSGIFITGAQLEVGTTATPYQRITDGVQDYFTYGSALPTLYQDSAGTTPVTAVGQPVGLMLDKSRGLVLGSELVPNGDFSGGATGWSVATGWSIASGVATATATGGSSLAVTPNPSIVSGRTYRVTLTILSSTVAGSGIGVNVGGTLVGNFTTPGTYSALIVAGATGVVAINARGAGTWEGSIDNISVRELPGLHASQPTALSRPVLSSRYNLLTYTEQFDNAVWTKDASSVTANAYTSPQGRVFQKFTPDTTNVSNHRVRQAYTVPAGTAHTLSWEVKAAGYSGIKLRASSAWVNFDLATGAIGNSLNVTSPVIESIGDGVYRVSATFSVGCTIVYIYVDPFNTVSADTAPFAGDGTSGIFISGASLVPTNEAHLPYQRVAAATDYDADFSKFPPFLSVDGTDDGMVTPSWDLTSTDKVTVVAGVRKLSDAAQGMLLELSASVSVNNGSFFMLAPLTTANYNFNSKGTVAGSATGSGFAAPITSVLSGLGDISGDRATLRVNGTQVAQATTDQGTGTYGNYPLYLFRRGGTSLPFNGRFYGLSIIGAQLSANDINVLERFTATKVGITI